MSMMFFGLVTFATGFVAGVEPGEIGPDAGNFTSESPWTEFWWTGPGCIPRAAWLVAVCCNTVFWYGLLLTMAAILNRIMRLSVLIAVNIPVSGKEFNACNNIRALMYLTTGATF
jgi:hypothetical protein